MANLGYELANTIEIPNGDDISDASSRIGVVDPDIHGIPSLAYTDPFNKFHSP